MQQVRGLKKGEPLVPSSNFRAQPPINESCVSASHFISSVRLTPVTIATRKDLSLYGTTPVLERSDELQRGSQSFSARRLVAKGGCWEVEQGRKCYGKMQMLPETRCL